MGWLTSIEHAVGREVGPALRTIGRAAPALGGVADFIPGIGPVLGTALTLGGSALAGYLGEKIASPGTPAAVTPGQAGLPALPGGSLPALPGAPVVGGAPVAALGNAAGPMIPQLTLQVLQQYSAAGLLIPFASLRVVHKSPRKGFEVVHINGGTFAVTHALARAWGVHKVHHKPPISIGQWHALEKSAQTIKKLREVEKKARKIAGFAHHHHAEKKGGKKK